MPRSSPPKISAPYSIEAERTVLGALLIDPDAIFKVVPILRSDDFYDPVYRSVFAAITALTTNHKPIDFLTVAENLKTDKKIQELGGSAFLAQLPAEVPTASHIVHYAGIVLEHSRRRQLVALGNKIAALAHEDGKSADELTELAEQQFLTLTGHANDQDPVRLAELGSARYDHYATLYEADDPTAHYGVRTGFADLDEKLTGLAPGQLIVLAGRPGMGKTALALDIARHVAFDQRKIVCVFSLEMSRGELFDRLFGASLSVPPWRLNNGKITEAEFNRMGSVLDQFQDYPLFIDDDANTDLVHLRSKARRHQMQHGLDLLIVDYLQLIEVTDRLAGENQTQRITYISKSLKRLARELHCPVLALSQLSRECDRRPDKRPQLSDLRDSGSIEQDGDRILMLYRECEYFEDCEHPEVTDVLIRKNRNGPTGLVSLVFDKERMSFRDMSRKPEASTPRKVPLPEFDQ